jgi:hypothetical protein
MTGKGKAHNRGGYKPPGAPASKWAVDKLRYENQQRGGGLGAAWNEFMSSLPRRERKRLRRDR